MLPRQFQRKAPQDEAAPPLPPPLAAAAASSTASSIDSLCTCILGGLKTGVAEFCVIVTQQQYTGRKPNERIFPFTQDKVVAGIHKRSCDGHCSRKTPLSSMMVTDETALAAFPLSTCYIHSMRAQQNVAHCLAFTNCTKNIQG